MKKSTAIAIITAVVLIAAGVTVGSVGLGISNCEMPDFGGEAFGAQNCVTTTFDITESFSNISVDTSAAEIILAPSQDGQCRVVCYDSERVEYTAEVKNDTLTVVGKTQPGFTIGISFTERISVTLYLPRSEYNSLKLESTSGGITVPAGFSVVSAELKSTSGSVECFANLSESLTVEATSGRVTVGNASGNVEVSSTSGSVNLSDMDADTISVSATSGKASVSGVTAERVEVKNSSGGIALENVSADEVILEGTSGSISVTEVIAGELDIENSSGSVKFDRSDAKSIIVNTSSGSVSGSLLTSKLFDVDTSSGGIDIPDQDPEGGTCQINTSSGGVKITIAD